MSISGELIVQPKNYFELKKVLKKCYDLGFYFIKPNQKYNVFLLWFIYKIRSIQIYDISGKTSKEINPLIKGMSDGVNYKEFLAIIMGEYDVDTN